MLRLGTSTLAIAFCLASLPLSPAMAQDATTGSSVRDEANSKAEAIVAQMTLDEKIGQLVNVAPAIPRLHIPAYNWWTESLHGALGAVPTTNFPEPIGLAATFDAPLVGDVAGAISTEVRALHTLGRQTGKLGHIGTGLDTWSPNINIFRDPRWGRGQETYGEDPYLTARMGVAFVKGMQGPNPDLPYVISTPKHFAVHSGPEPTRHIADVFVSTHDIEDTYLPAFRAAIVEGKAGSIMCAYNSIDGQPACANDLLLKDHLRGDWGFKGYVVSDCDAVTDISEHHKYAADPAEAVAVALKAGVDNECNTQTLSDTPGLGKRYKEAYERGLIGMNDIDRALVRLFSARLRNGDLPGIRTDAPVPVSAINTPEHQALALKAAIESLVLLKNDGTLPFKPDVKIALVGPLADATRVLRGNYSSPQSAPPISVLAGLRQAMPDAKIAYAPAAPSITDGNPIPASAFIGPYGKPGLQADYYNASGIGADGKATGYEDKPAAIHSEAGLASSADQLKGVSEHNKIVWTGDLVAPETGTYRIGVSGVIGTMQVDGKPVINVTTYSNWGDPINLVEVSLKKGQHCPLHFEMASDKSFGASIVWQRVSAHPDAEMQAAAKTADVVVAVVGLTSDLEGEESKLHVTGFDGGDRTSIDLPADQIELLQKAKALGKPLVVVLMNGSAINLAWAKQNASAIVEAWYPGESGGLAVGKVLAGAADPGGRLPLTFYESVKDLPPFDDYSMKGRTYRYFTGTPVYPFGYGLSYTSFAYGPLTVTPVNGAVENGVTVTADVSNTGTREGGDVAELYLTPPAFDGAPRLALRGFTRVSLKPGEHQQVTFTLSPRDLSFVTRDGIRQLTPGHYMISVGSGQPESGSANQSAPLDISRQVKIAD
ncbi:glycoside hydrolase family 3 C-terminal domain-containing protein [Asticcacaulis sp. EMRT-3]|uniref:glycoside hydrolase family 3 C-terminal domain-containing protein n=1 Tax=Asticcacaulis sp. EMRT-3 TaxID=3040349 RepID=UPI0024AF7548|nr:glycoside hydrolase family 3 C-terminal domain-containing protein [Asticcacaulis sp. EMRT-3]MDI7775815.1 glycoside hydrolase family 3 C-terminal domain-containing protein [Asticcacaulis sp. EMRT-3]